MKITTFKFPEISMCQATDPKLLAEAKSRGFDKTTPHGDLFSSLFFEGGSLDFKKNLDNTFKETAIPYLRSLMQSFEPKHEDKMAVCSMLLSELVDIK